MASAASRAPASIAAGNLRSIERYIRKVPQIAKPPLTLQVTTLWEYPSQHYGDGLQGSPGYRGATPSYIIWNLLQRYTLPKWLVVDPMCGSGTTIDVARDCERRALGYDLQPQRPDIFRHDARHLPLEDGKADFVFIDPPYSTHLTYSDDPRCVGKTDAADGSYYQAMEEVIDEIDRILRPGRYMALYVSDSYVHGKQFHPIGFELFEMLRRHFEPVDIISVVRHNKTLDMGNYRKAAEEENFFLRGFNYLFIMFKPEQPKQKPVPKAEHARAKSPRTAAEASQAEGPNTVEERDATARPAERPAKGGCNSFAGKGKRSGGYRTNEHRAHSGQPKPQRASPRPAADDSSAAADSAGLTGAQKPKKVDWRGKKKRRPNPPPGR